jgi:hypothetical protein
MCTFEHSVGIFPPDGADIMSSLLEAVQAGDAKRVEDLLSGVNGTAVDINETDVAVSGLAQI